MGIFMFFRGCFFSLMRMAVGHYKHKYINDYGDWLPISY